MCVCGCVGVEDREERWNSRVYEEKEKGLGLLKRKQVEEGSRIKFKINYPLNFITIVSY